MKIKNLFTLAVASFTIATACQKEPDLGPEEISISPAETTYEFPEKGGTYTIELTATVDWTIQGYDKKNTPWLSIEPSSGKASASVQTVTIKALANDGTNRKVDLVFYGNIMNQAPLTITQPGPKGDGSVGTGTVDDPFNVAAAIKYIDEHEYYGDDKNPNVSPEVYVKGVIASIEAVEPSFGNATYVISDGEGSTAELEVYRGKFLNGDKFTSEDQIKVGDEVVIAGQLTRFFETYEFTTGSRIHSLNGEAGEEPIAVDPAGTGTAEDPFNVAGAYKYIDDNQYYGDDKNPNVSPDVYVKGTIASIEEVDTGYGNATYTISDGEGTAELEVFRGYYLNGDKFTAADQIKVGDEVVVVGQLTKFFETYEFTTGSKIHSLNEQGGEEPKPVDEPESAEKITISDFLAKPVSETDWYELTGTIINIESATYGNFTMSDERGTVYVYGLVKEWANGENDKSFAEIGLEAGDIVTIWTLRAEHSGSPQAGGNNPAIYKGHEDGVPVTYPEGTVFLTFPDGNQKSVNNYTSTWQAIVDSYTYTLVNFNNNQNKWSYVKCGREKDPSVASISNDTPMPKLTSIEVNADKLNASKVNSIELSIYSDADQATLVAEGIAPKNGISMGILTFEIPAEYQKANQYYKLTFDCAVAGSNGPVQISKISYIAAE